MEYTDFEDFIDQSTAYLRACIEKANRHFGIGDYARYEYDLHRREIWWSDPDGPKVRGKVTIVGSISTVSDTWLWSWGNSHFDDVELGPILEVKAFGERESITKLVEPKWAADEVDGWAMTSVAARLLESQGAYRSPDDKGFLFLLFDHLEFVPEEEMAPYLPLKRETLEDPAQPQSATLNSPIPLALEAPVSPQASAPVAQIRFVPPGRDGANFIWIHRLTVGFLVVFAFWNGVAHLPSADRNLELAGVTVVWSLLIWKIATRPRKWGLGVGITLIVAIVLQTFLWISAIDRLERLQVHAPGDASIWRFLPYQILLALAATGCFLLRFHRQSSASAHGAAQPKLFKLKKNDIKQLIPPSGACFASDHITVEGMPIHFMYREEPDFEVDSGWRFLSGKETQAYIDDPNNLAIYDLNTIVNYDPAIIEYLQYPIGTHLERVGETASFKIEGT